MNGRLSRRIRRASFVSGTPTKQLKREYRAEPYCRRRTYGWPRATHKEREQFFINHPIWKNRGAWLS